jgi:hypothetical protein
MAGDDVRAQQPPEPEPSPGFWNSCDTFLGNINKRFHFFVSLPIVATISSFVFSHIDYLTAYQKKVDAVGQQQMTAAENTFSDVSKTFSTAITLQQLLFFNYHDAVVAGIDDDATELEAKNARAIYPKYDELRTGLRESIDLLSRRVELDLDWPSDIGRDAAKAGQIGADPMSRIKLGAYNFECDDEKNMPHFRDGKSTRSLPVPPDLLKENPGLKPLDIHWHSAKHELLTLYFCFDKDHGRIEAARRWAAMTKADAAAKKKFIHDIAQIRQSFDNEAVRLDAFLTLGARRIEAIHVKFRPRAWYCHIPLVREIVDSVTQKCLPIHTAEKASAS